MAKFWRKRTLIWPFWFQRKRPSEREMILYDSPRAARRALVFGWLSSDGRFWGNDEHQARWSGCTHIKCERGEIRERSYTICKSCRQAKKDERYWALPSREYDGSPVCVYGSDQHFFDEESIDDYCSENGTSKPNLKMVFCDAVTAPEIPEDFWSDYLPEDQYLDDVAPEIAKAVDALNALIRERAPTLSWIEGKTRVLFPTVGAAS